jgi:hypothetical protein
MDIVEIVYTERLITVAWLQLAVDQADQRVVDLNEES